MLPSSGTLIFRLLDRELLRCQKGTGSGKTAVSLSEVEERPIDRANCLSDDAVEVKGGLLSPTGLGLLVGGEGHS